jgi:hypothetical protein
MVEAEKFFKKQQTLFISELTLQGPKTVVQKAPTLGHCLEVVVMVK